MPLRYRLWLSFAPLVLLLAALGVGAVVSLGLVGGRIDGILRENYRSVEAMEGLADATARIDAAFRAALAGRATAKVEYEAAWGDCRRHLDDERGNVTEEGEQELVDRLTALTAEYRALGDRFFDPARPASERAADYDAPGERPGPLRVSAAAVRLVAGEIRRLNQASMERASRDARAAAGRVRLFATAGLLATLAATGLLAWRTTRTILQPVAELTRSAKAVGDGHFDRTVTAPRRDEIGGLVAEFNRMTAQLRDLKQSHAARLLRAQQASQAAIDSFPDPVLVVDPAGRVEMANPAARQLLGVLPGGDLPWVPPDRLRTPLAEALRDQRPFLTQSFDQAVTYRVGTQERAYVPQILPVRDPYGGTLGAAVVLSDVTRFRLLDEFKSDLVATASHELKTPLTGLRLAVHLLLEEAVGPLTDKQTGLLVDARENTERLVRIVDHLLSLARLEEGHEPLAAVPVDAAKLLEEAAERVRPVAAGRTLAVEAEPGLTISADKERLGHALDNLLVNAATYTEIGGHITLAARRTDDGRVELAVKDDGVGIPHEHVPHVFDKFFRIPGRARGQGTGLGLAIVREIVAAHGGEVACESAPGHGTAFRLTLPAAGTS